MEISALSNDIHVSHSLLDLVLVLKVDRIALEFETDVFLITGRLMELIVFFVLDDSLRGYVGEVDDAFLNWDAFGPFRLQAWLKLGVLPRVLNPLIESNLLINHNLLQKA